MAVATGYGSRYGSGYGYGSRYGDGSGDGSGSGYGSGYGYGDGSGYGSGYGDGSGYGSGYGDGYGYGSGYGDGYGYGYGDGYGYGYGSGSGSGDGSGYGLLTQAYADHPAVKQATAGGSKVELGIWRSGADARPVNGGSGDPVHAGLLQEQPGPLSICSRGFHATTEPGEWSGDRWWVVALFEPIERQGSKMASLKRLIVEELTDG